MFAAATADAVFLSRFGNDSLVYSQTRAGYTAGSALRVQFYWNLNLTLDSKRQRWANFIEVGPGIRFRAPMLPPSMFITVDLLSGAYLIRDLTQPLRFRDLRLGVWYAFTR